MLLDIESPLNDPDGTLVYVLTRIDYVFTAIFIVEAVLKITTYGFLFNGKDSYLRNAWNVIDFLIVVFAILTLVFSNIEELHDIFMAQLTDNTDFLEEKYAEYFKKKAIVPKEVNHDATIKYIYDVFSFSKYEKD